MTILRLVQQNYFKEVISDLKSSSSVPKTNNLYPLDPIIKDGLLCVGGRLRKADVSNQYKHPIILPNDSHITKLILTDIHQEVCHQGRGITLNKLRAYGYWIVGGSKVVAKFIRQYVMCRRLRRPTESQRMADLPKERVEPSPPFTFCGMDCFGPFIVKQGRKEIKRYGLLLTCMCSRAIHIEMLDDMSTDAFINGLRCFIAIRGAVRQIRSDQGSNFIGAKNEFERERNVSKITSYLLTKQCDFVLNAPCASHTGGVWERQIRTVRNILNSVLLLCPGRLDDSSLRTIFYEAMTIVNCRPLSVSEIDDPKTLEPLTPNHILTSKSEIPQPPPGLFVQEDLYLRKRWKRVQYILEQFWSRWKKEYMTEISLRQKWHEPRRNMRKGDIVLVKDMDLSRNEWPLANVVETKTDDDGLPNTPLQKGDTNTCFDSGSGQFLCCGSFVEVNGTFVYCPVGTRSKRGLPCEPCENDYYGDRCLQQCQCNSLQRCDNINGCVKQKLSSQTEYYVTDGLMSTTGAHSTTGTYAIQRSSDGLMSTIEAYSTTGKDAIQRSSVGGNMDVVTPDAGENGAFSKRNLLIYSGSLTAIILTLGCCYLINRCRTRSRTRKEISTNEIDVLNIQPAEGNDAIEMYEGIYHTIDENKMATLTKNTNPYLEVVDRETSSESDDCKNNNPYLEVVDGDTSSDSDESNDDDDYNNIDNDAISYVHPYHSLDTTADDSHPYEKREPNCEHTVEVSIERYEKYENSQCFEYCDASTIDIDKKTEQRASFSENNSLKRKSFITQSKESDTLDSGLDCHLPDYINTDKDNIPSNITAIDRNVRTDNTGNELKKFNIEQNFN